jgi:hypothetical protein
LIKKELLKTFIKTKTTTVTRETGKKSEIKLQILGLHRLGTLTKMSNVIRRENKC